MKKLLTILLLIVGCMFADTIVFKIERENKDGAVKTYNSEKTGEYVGILGAKAYLRAPNGKLKEFDCVDVISIFDDDSKPISWDCSKNTFVPKTLTEIDLEKIQKRPVIGGTMIAIGGAILFSNIDAECNNCETWKDWDDFYNNLNTKAMWGYAFIFLGGFLIAIGI